MWKSGEWAHIFTTQKKLVESILKAQEQSKEEIESLLKTLADSVRKDTAPQHQYYRDNFNSIDLHDRYHSDMQCHHKITGWEPKFIVSILETSFVNSFAIHGPSNLTFIQFCNSIAEEIINPEFKFE